ncbi:MAG: hypothetical protein CMC95_02840 [Flavobacteriales bacterium]|nr:hypothetical protein [Flavobacteriales bacterium]|tara:strand:- start:269 stop:1819 length:1551 start_codon:yes stop_codon:yes gene_type:complete
MKAFYNLLTLLIPFVGFSQDCPDFPELTDSTFSFYPDTIENLDSAYVGLYFEDYIYFESPSVIGDMFGFPYVISGFLDIAPYEVDSFNLISLNGLPDSFDYIISNNNGFFEANEQGCIKIFGVANENEIGIYNLNILIDLKATLPLVGSQSICNYVDSCDFLGYKLTISYSAGCTDNNACNFDENATIDDGSCNYPSASEIFIESCENIEWNGMLLDETGLYTYVTTNSNGCDSTVIIDLTIFESISENIIYGIPEPDPFSVSLYSASNNENNLIWSVEGGNIIENNGNSINIQWGNQSIGLITLVESNICNDFTNVFTVNIGGQIEPTWDCNDNFACIEQSDGSGNYQSLEECEANCSLVEPTWDCNDNFACIEQSDGSGNFQSLEECEANCSIIIEDSWNCVNDACVDPMDGTGIYDSLEECEANCSATSINETLINVNIYPNPSSNIFNLEFNSDSETEILVTNILGEQVYFESTKSNGEFNTQIDLSNYSKGIYNLTIKTSDGISNHKLILQ